MGPEPCGPQMSKVLQSLLKLVLRFQGAQARADEGRAGVQEELGFIVETKRVATQTPELCAFKNRSFWGRLGCRVGEGTEPTVGNQLMVIQSFDVRTNNPTSPRSRLTTHFTAQETEAPGDPLPVPGPREDLEGAGLVWAQDVSSSPPPASGTLAFSAGWGGPA